MPDAVPIRLASAIRALRSELQEAVRAREAEELVLRWARSSLSCRVEAAHEGGGEAGIKLAGVARR